MSTKISSTPDTRSLWTVLIQRETAVLWQSRSDSVQPLLFFLAIFFLFPLNFSRAIVWHPEYITGLIWTTALFSELLAADRLFKRDQDDGFLEQWLTQNTHSCKDLFKYSFKHWVRLKIFFHWLTTGFPIALIAPCLAATLNVDTTHCLWLMAGLALGTLCISYWIALSAALMLPLRSGSMLLSLSTLPLLIPIVIFGSSLAVSVRPQAQLAYLMAIFLVLNAGLPKAIGVILRLGSESQ